MAYKDKDKQKEAQREWVRQKRKGSTAKGSTSQGSTLKQPSPLETVDSFASEGAVVQNKSKFFTEQEFEQRYGKPKPQSHSPMMVGYVPPKN